MSSDGDDGHRSSSLEGVECTPRDQQVSGPPTLDDLRPQGPPPPLPVDAGLQPRPGPADPEVASDDSRPEQRWPVLADGSRLQGPHMPSGRFADSPRSRTRSRSRSSSSKTTSQDNRASTDSASGPDLPPAPVPREDAPDRAPAADDDGTDESGSWSDTSLGLGGQALAQAIETLLGMYRYQLQRTALLSNRELGGRVGGLRRHLHSKQWSYVSQHARRILDGEDLASWQTFEHRATHEYRPHRRPADDDC